jgi:hypothetical protein
MNISDRGRPDHWPPDCNWRRGRTGPRSSASWPACGATEPDLLVLANYGWNFNVRSFNPGGNHGSFFRISTHSVLMFAGAGVPAGLRIEEPYDSLNFVPAALACWARPRTVIRGRRFRNWLRRNNNPLF